jgi:hypothetical protein
MSGPLAGSTLVQVGRPTVHNLGLVAYGMRKGRFSYYLTSFGESRTKKLPTVARRSD